MPRKRIIDAIVLQNKQESSESKNSARLVLARRKRTTLFLSIDLAEFPNMSRTIDLGASEFGSLRFEPTHMVVKQISFTSRDRKSANWVDVFTCDFIKNSPWGILGPYFGDTVISGMDVTHECAFKTTRHQVNIQAKRILGGVLIDDNVYTEGVISSIITFYNYNPFP